MVPKPTEFAGSSSSSTWRLSPADCPPPSTSHGLAAAAAADASSNSSNNMKNVSWRPRSAPRAGGQPSSSSRSPSPLLFWTKKGASTSSTSSSQPQQQQQQQQLQAIEAAGVSRAKEVGGSEWSAVVEQQQQQQQQMRRESEDATYVDSVSNHLGKMTPIPPPTTTTTTTTRSGARTADGQASNLSRRRRDIMKDLLDRNGLESQAQRREEEQQEQQQPPSITREEYEALPLAIQRKYFSALERLRFAQESDEVDRIYNHYDLSSVNLKHRKHRQALSSPDTLWAAAPAQPRDSYFTAASDDSWVLSYPDKVSKAELTREEQVSLVKHLRASVILDAASAALAQAQLLRRHQHHHSSSSSSSSADEAHRLSTPDIDHSTATLSSRTGSPDSMTSGGDGGGAMAGSSSNNNNNNGSSSSSSSSSNNRNDSGGSTVDRDAMRESLYDSIRWLDEDGALDLGLALDDYHANLREDVVPQTGKNRRPSFRRRLSISKLPFGRRPSLSGRPDSRAASPLQTPSSPEQQQQQQHSPQRQHNNNNNNNNNNGSSGSSTQRRLSRTLSVMSPSRHVHSGSTSIIDPSSATHYQDPEARQKLRAYLASPTKFDEAVQFGFPARDPQQQQQQQQRRRQSTTGDRKRQSRQRLSPSASSENMRSFLYFDGDEDEDDDTSDHEDNEDEQEEEEEEEEDDDDDDDDDASSVSDPDSPRTPQMGGLMPPPGHHHPTRTSTDPLHLDRCRRRATPTSTTTTTGSTLPRAAAGGPASREMTMRMTLTRPDLRADEELIYGWRHQGGGGGAHHPAAPGRRSQSAQLTRADVALANGQTAAACWSSHGGGGDENNSNADKMWAVVDHWNAEAAGGAAGEQNVVRRFWNKVRRT